MVDSGESALVDEMLTHLRADFSDYEPASRVASFYANRSVFITGATGFIGKALVEKLVRSCKDIKKIYLLVREKRGKDVNSRLKELIQSQIFNRIKSQPDGRQLLEEKLHAIQGDITLEGFGISRDNMELLSKEVGIVFNSAATIRFVEPIDVAVRNNIYSVSQLVQFCNQLENLQALIHLSTAYSNCHKRDTIYEIFYEPPMRGEQIISAVSALRDVQNEIRSYPALSKQQQQQQLKSRSRSALKSSAAPQPSPSPSPSASESHSQSQSCSQQPNGHQQQQPPNETTTPATSGASSNGSGDSESRSACDPQIFYKKRPASNGGGGEQADEADLLEEFAKLALRKSNRPNTYTFTKAIAESYLLDLVRKHPERYLGADGIPVAIVRPSIVGGAWREPDVGFVDNYNGGTGAILSLYTGALQAMPGVGSRVADMVPVDMVVNMILCAGYFLASSAGSSAGSNQDERLTASNDLKQPAAAALPIRADQGVFIFNFVSGFRNPMRWHQVTGMIRELAYKYPSKFQVRLCGSYFVRADYNLYAIYDYLNQYLPARLQDSLATLLNPGGEQQQQRQQQSSGAARNHAALIAYARIKAMTDTLTPFTSNQWLLCDSNVQALYGRLTAKDRQLFQFDVANINWPNYIRNYIIGARIYTLKDEPRNVPNALGALRKRQFVYRSSLMILVILFYCLFVRDSQLEAALVSSIGGLF